MCTNMCGRGSSSGKGKNSGSRAGSGSANYSNLSDSEKLNYDVVSQQLRTREFRYDSNDLADMHRAANALNRDYDSDDMQDSGMYGMGGAMALREYRDRLVSDYDKEQKRIQAAVKKYESSKTQTGKARYNEAKAKVDAEKRRHDFFSQF